LTIKSGLWATYIHRLCKQLKIPERGIHKIRKTDISALIEKVLKEGKGLEDVRKCSDVT
jgi:hypothetical protein